MLLLNKTLLRLARGLWQWILAIAAVSFLTLVGTTALAEIVSQFLGSLFEPQVVLSTVKSAVGAAFLASVFICHLLPDMAHFMVLILHLSLDIIYCLGNL